MGTSFLHLKLALFGKGLRLVFEHDHSNVNNRKAFSPVDFTMPFPEAHCQRQIVWFDLSAQGFATNDSHSFPKY